MAVQHCPLCNRPYDPLTHISCPICTTKIQGSEDLQGMEGDLSRTFVEPSVPGVETNSRSMDSGQMRDTDPGLQRPLGRTVEPTGKFGFVEDRIALSQDLGTQTTATLLERYHFIKTINQGGMGKIVLMQERLSGRFVAMKVMLERAAKDPSLVQQFVREAIITARLQHPHIIPVYDLGFFSENELYYTMRYIEGQPFDELLPVLSLIERVRVLRSAALAVDYAHSRGLWHRDLKPSNILVGSLGDAYVIDWGLVSIQSGMSYSLDIPKIVVESVTYDFPDHLLERTCGAITAASGGGLMGTVPYLSPEQIEDRHDLDARADVWAFGIMLYQALTEEHPIEFSSPMQLFFKIVTEDIMPPSTKRPDIPKALDALCMKMLVKDREARLANLGDFVKETTQFLNTIGSTVTGLGPYSPTPQTPSGKVVDNGQLGALMTIHDQDRQQIHKSNIEATAQIQQLVAAQAVLAIENERFKKKNEILMRLSQLSFFDVVTRRKLMMELASL